MADLIDQEDLIMMIVESDLADLIDQVVLIMMIVESDLVDLIVQVIRKVLIAAALVVDVIGLKDQKVAIDFVEVLIAEKKHSLNLQEQLEDRYLLAVEIEIIAGMEMVTKK